MGTPQRQARPFEGAVGLWICYRNSGCIRTHDLAKHSAHSITLHHLACQWLE